MKSKILTILFFLLYFNLSFAQSIDTLCIKNASIYEYVSFGLGTITSRFVNMPAVISQIKDSKTDFVHRAGFRWNHIPDSAAASSPYEQFGFTYNKYRQAIQQIKASVPNIKICGAVAAQRIDTIEINDLTGDTINSTQTWQMGINPQKWGIPVTQAAFQDTMKNNLSVVGVYPDISNAAYQKFFLDLIKKQIDCGVDAIWIDLLYGQAVIMYIYSGNNANHISVQQSFNAATAIVDSIHQYGYSIGKYIYVGTWGSGSFGIQMPYPKPHLDFATESVSSQEILSNTLSSNWITTHNSIRSTFGNIPILVLIDWGFDVSPMVTFSQQLTSQQQKKFLANADTFFYNRNMTFTYPMMGGNMGSSPVIKSFGLSNAYISVAPEFNTYEIIKELALKKVTNVESASIEPERFELYQNYPNPFGTATLSGNPTTSINFSLPRREHVILKVFDVFGREVATLVNGVFDSGEHSVVFDAGNLTSGIYFYRMATSNYSKIILMGIIK